MYGHQVYNSNGGLAPKVGLVLGQSWMVIPMNKHNTLGHQNEVSHTYLLLCLRYGEKHTKYILISCGCMLLFTKNYAIQLQTWW